jgi:catechol 2,3-dioxygenase-like lactoylglutathione lyase family enzyme
MSEKQALTVSLSGLTLHVADVERSIAFYTRIPGVEMMFHRPGDFALLRVGPGRLGLLKHDTGKFHMEFDTDNLDEMYQHLLAEGIETQGPPAQRAWGERDLYVLDPDGNIVEFGISDEERDRSSDAGNWS